MYISDLQYFGTIQFVQTLIKEKTIVFDTEQPYSKMSFKNRTIIATAQGMLSLSIPIIGGRDQKKPIHLIQIDNHHTWAQQHYKAILANYKRAPFFEYYEESIKNLYSSKPIYLIDFLLDTQLWIKQQLKGEWTFVNSIHLAHLDKQQKRFDPWLPKNYHQIPNPIQYHQVFEDKTGFLPNLSILDLLFCCGGRHASKLMST